MRRVSVGRVPMRRVPIRRVLIRRGYIVMVDTFTWFIKYCCIIDVFMRNERLRLNSCANRTTLPDEQRWRKEHRPQRRLDYAANIDPITLRYYKWVSLRSQLFKLVVNQTSFTSDQHLRAILGATRSSSWAAACQRIGGLVQRQASELPAAIVVTLQYGVRCPINGLFTDELVWEIHRA